MLRTDRLLITRTLRGFTDSSQYNKVLEPSNKEWYGYASQMIVRMLCMQYSIWEAFFNVSFWTDSNVSWGQELPSWWVLVYVVRPGLRPSADLISYFWRRLSCPGALWRGNNLIQGPLWFLWRTSPGCIPASRPVNAGIGSSTSPRHPHTLPKRCWRKICNSCKQLLNNSLFSSEGTCATYCLKQRPLSTSCSAKKPLITQIEREISTITHSFQKCSVKNVCATCDALRRERLRRDDFFRLLAALVYV